MPHTLNNPYARALPGALEVCHKMFGGTGSKYSRSVAIEKNLRFGAALRFYPDPFLLEFQYIYAGMPARMTSRPASAFQNVYTREFTEM